MPRLSSTINCTIYVPRRILLSSLGSPVVRGVRKMFSRRSFIQTFMRITSAAAGAKLTPRAKAQRSAPESSAGGTQPPSIAALTSMAGQVRPITNDERKARIEKARRLMTDQKFGAIILSGGTSSLYFANLPMGGGERLWALVLPAKGKPFLVCPAFEND